jgi:hypothetical protein
MMGLVTSPTAGTRPARTVLAPAECRTLLRTGGTGRIVYTRRALPEACPVAFVHDSGVLAFAVDDAGVAAAVVGNAVAAFEVDGLDVRSGTAWTVLAVGETFEVTGSPALDRIRRKLVGPWVPALGDRVVALRPQQLSGWRRAVSGPLAGPG